jgi:UDP-2,3-diacylglucosamine hydrolase
LGATFNPDGAHLDVAGWRAFVAHGDGLTERHAAARLMHRVTRWPVTAWAFRWIHPDLGIRLVDAMSGRLADRTRDSRALDEASAAQARFAEKLLSDHAELDPVILGHTHRAALVRVGGERWYLNPGAWMAGGCYALVTGDGPRLCTEGGA